MKDQHLWGNCVAHPMDASPESVLRVLQISGDVVATLAEQQLQDLTSGFGAVVVARSFYRCPKPE